MIYHIRNHKRDDGISGLSFLAQKNRTQWRRFITDYERMGMSDALRNFPEDWFFINEGRKVLVDDFVDSVCGIVFTADSIYRIKKEFPKIYRARVDFVVDGVPLCLLLLPVISIQQAEQYKIDLFIWDHGFGGPECSEKFREIWLGVNGESVAFEEASPNPARLTKFMAVEEV